MSAKDARQKCVLVILTEGFEEIETIVILSRLRQAGFCVKSVGLSSGLVGGAHGVWIMPDVPLADLERSLDVTAISAVILPDGAQGLSRLEADPRVHKLLRQVVAHQGQIVTDREGLRVPQAAAVWNNEPGAIGDTVLLRDPGQPLETFVWELIRRLQ